MANVLKVLKGFVLNGKPIYDNNGNYVRTDYTVKKGK